MLTELRIAELFAQTYVKDVVPQSDRRSVASLCGYLDSVRELREAFAEAFFPDPARRNVTKLVRKWWDVLSPQRDSKTKTDKYWLARTPSCS